MLQQTTKLTHLNMKNCWYLPAKTLTSLQRLPELASLNIAIFRRMTIHGLGHLQVQPNLRFSRNGCDVWLWSRISAESQKRRFAMCCISNATQCGRQTCHLWSCMPKIACLC